MPRRARPDRELQCHEDQAAIGTRLRWSVPWVAMRGIPWSAGGDRHPLLPRIGALLPCAVRGGISCGVAPAGAPSVRRRAPVRHPMALFVKRQLVDLAGWAMLWLRCIA